ncbi:hypothetical protein HMPREF9413_4781, partial [Paenibacillus sp. HGF7]
MLQLRLFPVSVSFGFQPFRRAFVLAVLGGLLLAGGLARDRLLRGASACSSAAALARTAPGGCARAAASRSGRRAAAAALSTAIRGEALPVRAGSPAAARPASPPDARWAVSDTRAATPAPASS